MNLSYASNENCPFYYPFYFGVTGGGGSTTWEQLVPSKHKQSDAMNLSTPIQVREGGALWGLFAGYEIIPFFAFEVAYMHFPDAWVSFDSMSLFSFNHNDITKIKTQTETVSLSGKIMFQIPHTNIRAFSSFGVAGLHRNDAVMNRWRGSPTFNVGFNDVFGERLMVEVGFNYTAGFGKSEIDPAQDYMPFLYAGYLRLAVRF